MKPLRFGVEPLLAGRSFLAPRLVGGRLYFVSDVSGRLSLHAMEAATSPVEAGASALEQLLPTDVALQNPHLCESGDLYHVLPELDRVLVMIDQDGDENYQPMLVPLEGGTPEPLLDDRWAGQAVECPRVDARSKTALFLIDPRTEPVSIAALVDLATGRVTDTVRSPHAMFFAGADAGLSRILLLDEYTFGDGALYLWERGRGERRLVFGTPLSERRDGEEIPVHGMGLCPAVFTEPDRLLLTTTLHDDRYGLATFAVDDPDGLRAVPVRGLRHVGAGVLARLDRWGRDRYTVTYNIDGCSWIYEGRLVGERAAPRLVVERVLAGEPPLEDGVVESLSWDAEGGRYALSFASATSSSRLWTVDGAGAIPQTRSALGVDADLLSPGEDASYVSHDGLRVSARLFLPAPKLGTKPPWPVVFYIHGGPQGQERPDFSWFSLPLIQLLTLNGLAVFVPNVRGSEGYGLSYMKQVDGDWGGQDRLDHVAAFQHLSRDRRLDMRRAGVTGRSYGGFMTLTLAGRHPGLWKAACDLFGPYDLFSFLDRLPKVQAEYFRRSIGDPVEDAELLRDRSPSTHLGALACPLLVIQGRNDPRVTEQESRDLVERLRAEGHAVDYLVFEDEGHDILKHANKIACYTRIAEFFAHHLGA